MGTWSWSSPKAGAMGLVLSPPAPALASSLTIDDQLEADVLLQPRQPVPQNQSVRPSMLLRHILDLH